MTQALEVSRKLDEAENQHSRAVLQLRVDCEQKYALKADLEQRYALKSEAGLLLAAEEDLEPGRAGDAAAANRNGRTGDIGIRRELERQLRRQGEIQARILTEVERLRDWVGGTGAALVPKVELLAHEVRDVGKGSGALTLGVIQLARVVGLWQEPIPPTEGAEWIQASRGLSWRLERAWAQHQRILDRRPVSVIHALLGGADSPDRRSQEVDRSSPPRPHDVLPRPPGGGIGSPPGLRGVTPASPRPGAVLLGRGAAAGTAPEDAGGGPPGFYPAAPRGTGPFRSEADLRASAPPGSQPGSALWPRAPHEPPPTGRPTPRPVW